MPNTIYAELKQYQPIPEDYHIEILKDKPSFLEDHIAWSIYTRKDDDPVRVQLQKEIDEYNSVVKVILDTPGLVDFFLQHDLVLTKEQILEQFSQELADIIFTLKDYPFVHQLHINNNQLFDIASQKILDYKIDKPEHSLVIENLSEDERDATFYLCVQLEKDGLMPENTQDDQMYDWFESYEQARDDLEKPDGRVMRVINLLSEKGYLKVYSIQPKEKHPSLCLRYPCNGSFEVYVLDLDYINDAKLTEQIKNYLKIGVFGRNSGEVTSYSLLSNYTVADSEVSQIVKEKGGSYIDLNDGNSFGIVFDVDLEQMKEIAKSIGCEMFIFGMDYVPSKPELYTMQNNGEYKFSPISETVEVIDDLEEIAPNYSEMWEDLYFNDYFRECLCFECGL